MRKYFFLYHASSRIPHFGHSVLSVLCLPGFFPPQGFHAPFLCPEHWPQDITWQTPFHLSGDGTKVISEVHTIYVFPLCLSQISFNLTYLLILVTQYLRSSCLYSYLLLPTIYQCLAFKYSIIRVKEWMQVVNEYGLYDFKYTSETITAQLFLWKKIILYFWINLNKRDC